MSTKWKRRLLEALLSLSGGLLGLGLVAAMHAQIYGGRGLPLLIAAFGASAVVLYGCPSAPIAQPRNLFCGSLLSSFIGVGVAMLLPHHPVWLQGVLAVSLSLAAMSLTGTMHPPGGAMAFIAAAGPEPMRALGFTYLLYPIATGIVIMFAVALLVHALAPDRRYPERWW